MYSSIFLKKGAKMGVALLYSASRHCNGCAQFEVIDMLLFINICIRRTILRGHRQTLAKYRGV